MQLVSPVCKNTYLSILTARVILVSQRMSLLHLLIKLTHKALKKRKLLDTQFKDHGTSRLKYSSQYLSNTFLVSPDFRTRQVFKDKFYGHIIYLLNCFSIIHLFIHYLFFLSFSFLFHYFYCFFLVSFGFFKLNTIRSEQCSIERCCDNAVLSLNGQLWQVHNMHVIIRSINFRYYFIVNHFTLLICSIPTLIRDLICKIIFDKFLHGKPFEKDMSKHYRYFKNSQLLV